MDNLGKQNTQVLGILDQVDATYACALLTQALDTKINDCRLEYLKEWEGDHATSAEPFNTKIMELEIQKTQLKQTMLESNRERANSTIQLGEHDNSYARNITF